MKITGVICEYNPFHSGHEYQLAKAREVTNADAIVCVMGGNFVQRGEPAVINKHARARMAAVCGADLVVELPVPWAIASAERFASGGVALLDAMGADFVAFGAEDPDVEALHALAQILLTENARELTSKHLLSGLSYASARERVARELLGDKADLLKKPNNILAVEYLKALQRQNSSIVPVAIPRFGPDHDGGENMGFASAMTVRELLYGRGDVSRFMPEPAFGILREELEAGRGPVRPDALEQAQLYKLRTMSFEELASLPDCTEGLERRLTRAIRSEATLEGLLSAVKTKRYALSRLRRTLLAALLGVEARHQLGTPPYIRVLAIGKRGREALRQIKADSALPIITKPASARLLSPEALEIFSLEAAAGDVYALAYPSPSSRLPAADWTTSPSVID